MTPIERLYPASSMPDADWWEVLWPRPCEVLQKVGLGSKAEVVDLCCGDGMFTIPLARMVRHVTAIDLDPAMLARAREKAETGGVTNCRFVVGDASDLAAIVGFPIDAVLLANTFHGVPDKTRLTRAVASVLTRGGLFAVINWHARPREETPVLGSPRGPRTGLRVSPTDLITVVTAANFRLCDVVELPPYHYATVFERLGP